MSLLLGMVAAVAWGVHDLCVRHVSQTTGIFASLIAVLVFGTVLVIPISLYAWGEPMGENALRLSILSGVCFGLAAIAHYKAFSIGPVRLVAPIIGSYPILSVGWAMASGSSVTLLQWIAVGMVIAGVGYVASSDSEESAGQGPLPAILWSIAAGSGFAITFAIGQSAVSHGGELALLAPTRVAAVVIVVAIALVLKVNWIAGGKGLWILALMGVLDAVALGSVLSAGGFPNPEFAAVAASTFGLITVVLAALFLRERITALQCVAVLCVFAAIGYLAL
ncbi:MAG: DMT family transporter [Pseudomonadota bacterium]